MTRRDRANLQFLLEAGENILREWHARVSEDDKKYASALLTCYSWELLDDIRDCNKAKEYLEKFRTSKSC